jgi:hypothetical protein
MQENGNLTAPGSDGFDYMTDSDDEKEERDSYAPGDSEENEFVHEENLDDDNLNSAKPNISVPNNMTNDVNRRLERNETTWWFVV